MRDSRGNTRSIREREGAAVGGGEGRGVGPQVLADGRDEGERDRH